MLRDNVVHTLNQLKAFEGQVRGAFLIVTNAEELIFVSVLSRVIPDMLHQPGGDITPVVRDGFAIQQKQHSLQVRQLIPSPTPVEAKAPAVMRNQIVDDDLLAEAKGTVSFVIP